MAPPHQSENSAPATVTTVDVTAARDLIAAAGGCRYLDVRTEEELSKLGHLVPSQGKQQLISVHLPTTPSILYYNIIYKLF